MAKAKELYNPDQNKSFFKISFTNNFKTPSHSQRTFRQLFSHILIYLLANITSDSMPATNTKAKRNFFCFPGTGIPAPGHFIIFVPYGQGRIFKISKKNYVSPLSLPVMRAALRTIINSAKVI